MKINRHTLTNRDLDTLTADCSVCGQGVSIAKRGSRGKTYYICRIKMNSDAMKYYKPSTSIRHSIKNKNMETRTGDCVLCGPVSVNIKGECSAKIGRRNKNYLTLDSRRISAPDGFSYLLGDKKNIFAAQDSQCKICKKKLETMTESAMDHCHETLKPRGVLCQPCNQALGFFQDDINTLKSAIEYLEYYEKETLPALELS